MRDQAVVGDPPPARDLGPYALLLFGMIIWTFTWYRKTGEISPKELSNRISQLFLFGFKDHEFAP